MVSFVHNRCTVLQFPQGRSRSGTLSPAETVENPVIASRVGRLLGETDCHASVRLPRNDTAFYWITTGG